MNDIILLSSPRDIRNPSFFSSPHIDLASRSFHSHSYNPLHSFSYVTSWQLIFCFGPLSSLPELFQELLLWYLLSQPGVSLPPLMQSLIRTCSRQWAWGSWESDGSKCQYKDEQLRPPLWVARAWSHSQAHTDFLLELFTEERPEEAFTHWLLVLTMRVLNWLHLRAQVKGCWARYQRYLTPALLNPPFFMSF